MNTRGASILGMGMLTPVGLTAPQSAASVRAGITRFAETSVYDKRFEPFTMSLLPDEALPPLHPELEKAVSLTSRQVRLLRLAAPALQEALIGDPDGNGVPLFLGAPEHLKSRPQPLNEGFFAQLGVQSGVGLDIAASKVIFGGRAAGLMALQAAMACLAAGKHSVVLAGGVDTYLDLYLLGTLDMEDRILGQAVMDGFIPGEGAGFVLLSSRESSFPKLSPVFTGFEEGHLGSDEPYQGEGLATVFAEILGSGAFEQPVREVYSAMNGENHWAKEWGVAFLRNQGSFDPSHGMHHPADCLGDTGAASGIILTILAAIGIGKGYRRSPALITCSSDLGNRAAVAVSST